MNLEQLETFIAVSRARSFSRAAVLLDLAQPTLSGRIAALERELGAELFHRRGHTLDLTDVGHALEPYAERMLALRKEGWSAALRAARGDSGQLTLGANPTCSQYVAPRFVERFVQDRPRDRVRVTTQLSPSLMEALLDGVVELALCALARADPRAETLWKHTSPLHLVAAASHPLGRAGMCTRADLATHTILSTQAGPTRLGLSKLTPVGSEARVEATAGDVMRELLMRGVGVSVLPDIAVWEELKRGDIVPVTVTDCVLPDYEIALVSWPGRSLSPASQALVRLARDNPLADLLG